MRASGRIVLVFCAVSVGVSCVPKSKSVTTASGLEYRVVVPGAGLIARTGDSVRIHETTTLVDGTVIYSTKTKDNSLTFLLGGNQDIAGVDEGVTGMRAGERRALVVTREHPAGCHPVLRHRVDRDPSQLIDERR